MSKNIRYGTFLVNGFSSIVNDGIEDGLCEMGGIISWTLNEVFDRLRPRGFNCTLFHFDEFGSYQKGTGNYTGMIGAMFNGEIDFATMPVYYPLKDEQELIETSATFAEDTMTMISFYNVSVDQKAVDILQTYGTAPMLAWAFIFFSYLAFIFLLHVGLKLHKSSKSKTDAIWITTMAFLDQDNYPTTTTFLAAISLGASISMFFLMSYTTNCISSDLVVVEKPIVFSKYLDFLDAVEADEKESGKKSERIVGFSNLLPEFEKFRDADEHSLESKMFRYRYLIGINAETVLKVSTMTVKQTCIIIGREVLVDGACYVMLPFVQSEHPNLRALRVQEDEPKKFTNVMAWRKGAHPQFAKYVAILFSRMHEAGLLQHTYWHAPEVIAVAIRSQFMTGDPKITTELKSKISKFIDEVRPELIDVSLENLKSLNIIYSYMIVLALMILIYEISFHAVDVWVLKRKPGKVTDHSIRRRFECDRLRRRV